MLRELSINTDASTCDSGDSGMCTAIWSPSKSALNAVQNQGVNADGLAFDQHRFERLNTQAVQRGSAVQHDRVLADDVFQDVPDHGSCCSTISLACLMVVQ